MDADPWNWSVQDVQQFFRNEAATYIADMPYGRLPQLDTFLSNLRDNDVAGVVLLTTIDGPSLRDDCGVTKLGERSAVLRCINKLRKQSVIHSAQTASFGLQTPPHLPIKAPLPLQPSDTLIAEPVGTGPVVSDVEPIPAVHDHAVAGHVRNGEIEIEDERGRKRRKLDLSKPEAPPKFERMLRDLTSASARKENFGVLAFPIDEIFYGRLAFGQELDQLQPTGNVLIFGSDQGDGMEDNNFQFTQQNQSLGESQYVYSHIRHFMNESEKGVLVRRGSREALGFLPYRDIPGLATRSALVLQFTAQSEEPVAVKENAAYLLSGFDLDEPPQESPGENDYLLEKYRPTGVLPLYGESEDEEGSYGDDETLTVSDDMNEEAEEVNDAEDVTLSREDAERTIEAFINDCIANWKELKLPRLEEKRAWTIWKRTRQSRTIRDALIQGAEARMNQYSERLNKLIARMLSDKWETGKQLREGCEVMEPTIEGREEQRWMTEVWKRRQEPTRALRRSAKKILRRASTTEPKNRGIIIDARDRFSMSPAAVNGEEILLDTTEIRNQNVADKNHDIADEIQYDADDDLDHSPRSSPPISPVPSDFIVTTPEEANNLEEQGDHTENEEDSELAFNPSATKTGNGKEGEYESAEQDSESELPSPSTLAPPPSQKSSHQARSNHIDLTLWSDSPVRHKPGRPSRDMVKKEINMQSNPLDATASDVERWDWDTLVREQDRQRILIKLLKDAGSELRDRLDTILRDKDSGRKLFKIQLHPALQSMRYEMPHPKLREDIAAPMKKAAEMYISWNQLVILQPGKAMFDKQTWDRILHPAESDKQFQFFTEMLTSCLNKKGSKLFFAAKSSPLKPGSSFAPIDISSASSDPPRLPRKTPIKKRRREFKRSEIAQGSREMAISRQQRYNESQITNSAQLEAMIQSDPSASGIEINPAKTSQQASIYIRDKIARKMKAHQIDGARFLWREITADGDEGAQGCILAHTMGLGKTMQTISLLVALNEAAASRDPEVYRQLPPQLRAKDVRGRKRQLRTLILCPPAIVQNWRREIEFWASKQLGNVLALESLSKGTDYLHEWLRVGGVLLAGYQMFHRALSQERKNAKIVEGVKELEDILLKGPEIVVADEAQALKNEKAGISMLTSRIDTLSRVALTGTPMSNDVDEIFSLMSWTAPGFLGDASEFRNHFAQPIKEGLYVDSTAAQRRLSVKRLTGLHIEIQPKIDRANIEVLRGSLKPKIEYVITVSLTPVQDALYRQYIGMLQSGDRTEKASQLTLFGWLADLTLLTNHPQCLHNKLSNPPRRKPKKSKPGDRTPSTALESGAATPLSVDTTDTEQFQLAEDGAASELAAVEEISALDQSEIQHFLGSFPDSLQPQDSAKVTVFLELLDYCLQQQDKVLVFSSSIPTINYLGSVLEQRGKRFGRIDGATGMDDRAEILTNFRNNGKFSKHGCNTMLISTKAGGVGLNIQDANRVFIFDFRFNPTVEEQAIGRAYRLGQMKPVYVYRFVTGGTFETNIYNKQLFKSSLSARVVDKKNPRRNAERNAREYIYEPKPVPQGDLAEEAGKDPRVLDRLLQRHGTIDTNIRAIKTMETLQEEVVDAPLDEAEQKEVDLEVEQRRPKGSKKFGNVSSMALSSTAPIATSGHAMPGAQGYAMPAASTHATASTQSVALGSSARPSMIVRLPLSKTLQQLPPTQSDANVNRNADAPQVYPMGGLPMPLETDSASN